MNAQSNYLDGDPIWACHELCNYGIANCFERDDYNLYLCGDTTISDTLYKKLCRSGTWGRYWVFNPSSNCELGSYIYTWPAGFLREDGMRMYYRSDQTPDTLLYDFDLTIGDTLPSSFIHDASNTGPLVVTFIDSLLVETDWRNRFHFNDDQTTLLMEGIGSTYGLLIPMTFNWACSTCHAMEREGHPTARNPTEIAIYRSP